MRIKSSNFLVTVAVIVIAATITIIAVQQKFIYNAFEPNLPDPNRPIEPNLPEPNAPIEPNIPGMPNHPGGPNVPLNAMLHQSVILNEVLRSLGETGRSEETLFTLS